MTAPSFDDLHIRKRFAAEWLVLLVAAIGFAGVLGWMWIADRDATQQRETDRLHAQATVVERNATRQFDAVNQVLQGFIGRVDIQRHDPASMAEAASHLQLLSGAMPDVRLLFYLDENGIGRAFSDHSAEFLGRDLSSRPYFRPIKSQAQANKLYVSEPFMTLTGEYVINVMRVLTGPAGEFRGIVGAGLEASQYRVLLNSVLYAPDMWVSIAHGSGVQFMMEPDKPGQAGLQLDRPGSLFRQHRESGLTETVHQGVSLGTGERRFMVIRTIAMPHLSLDAPLVLAVSRDWASVFERSRQLGRNYLAIAVLLLATGASGLVLAQRLRLQAARAAWASQQAIHERDDVLNRFFSLNADLFAVLDQAGRFKQFNEAWSQMLGYQRDDLLNTHPLELVHAADRPLMHRMRHKLMAGQAIQGVILRVQHRDGHLLEIAWRALPSEDQFFLSGRDVTAEQAAQREVQQLNARLEAQSLQLQDMAFHDGLTGVFNRRHFDEALQTEWRAGLRSGQSLALLLLDIDHFKLYNDTYGHLQGDECLRLVASEFQLQCQRPRDLVARYGGEEFVALLPDTDLAGAHAKAQEVVAAIGALNIRHAPSPIAPHVTVSIGVAAIHPTVEAVPQTLIQAADDALYRAKSVGRNRSIAAAQSHEVALAAKSAPGASMDGATG